MNRWQPHYPNNLLRRLIVVLVSLVITAVDQSSLSTLMTRLGLAATITHGSPVNFGTATVQPALRERRTQKQTETEGEEEEEELVRKEDLSVGVAMALLRRFLPDEARLTSGYRTPEDQLRVIRSYAQENNIPVPNNMKVDDPDTWRPALSRLRSLGYIIADPNKTPHASNRIVFDVAGTDFTSIKSACDKAAEKGWVIIKHLIFEKRNRAVHVELEVTKKGALELNLPVKSSVQTSSSDSPEAAPSPPDDYRLPLLQRLKELHDSEPDPSRQIIYDQERIKLIEPNNFEDLRILDEEIRRHQQEREQLATEDQKRSALKEIGEAQREGRLEQVERRAEQFVKDFPEDAKAKDMLAQIRVERLVSEATDAWATSEYSGCETASQKIDEVLKASPGNTRAQRIKGEIDACLSGYQTSRAGKIILGALLVAGMLVGLYFLLRPRKWVLEGIYGSCKGEVFLLDQERIKIGALDSPEEDVDIVISDAKHKISRWHCTMRRNGRHWYLKDKSSNGTKINDQEIEKERYVRLRSGDEISLADEAVLLLRPK